MRLLSRFQKNLLDHQPLSTAQTTAVAVKGEVVTNYMDSRVEGTALLISSIPYHGHRELSRIRKATPELLVRWARSDPCSSPDAQAI